MTQGAAGIPSPSDSRWQIIRGALRDDRGAVAAEFAAAMPAVVLVIVLALGALQAASLQLRVVDAAAVGARSLGRAESAGDAESRVQALVGEHDLSSSLEGALVCVTVSAPIAFAGASALGVTVSGRSCALSGGQ